MAQNGCITELQTLHNGLKSPLYFDGQVVRADDLNLDRTSHDAELWRMRRLMHGWGIVAGFIVVPENDGLRVLEGYGIAPSGAEICLPDGAWLGDIAQILRNYCGPGAAGCDLDAHVTEQEGPLTGWLVARPVSSPAAPRAALPQDCTHPGNALYPTLTCGAVTLELHCQRPEGHPAPTLDCESLQEILGNGAPIAMPLPHPEPDLLVLARIQIGEDGLQIDLDGRRHLYPVSLLQDFMTACQCGRAQPVPDTSVPGQPPREPPTRPGGTAPKGLSWKDLQKYVKRRPFDPEPDPLADNSLIDRLKELGIQPIDVLNKPVGELVGLGLSETEVLNMTANVAGLRDVILSPRF